MATQHNRRLLRRRQGNHLEIPRHVTKTVGNITDHLSRESLITIGIRETESNAAARMRDHGPVPPIPTVWATVKRICSLRCFRGWVLIRKNVIRCPINHEAAVLDPVCVAAWDATEVRMLAVLRSSVSSSLKQSLPFPFSLIGATYNTVIASIVKASHNVSFNAIGVIDEQIRDTGSVGDEIGTDAYALNDIFAIFVWACVAPCN